MGRTAYLGNSYGVLHMQRNLIALLVFLFFSTAAIAGDYADVNVQKINDHIYAMLGGIDIPNKENGGYINNILVIIGDKGVILVDAGSHRDIASHVYDAIRKITDRPVTHILITHHHGDHHLGASFFPNAEVIASEYCAEQIQENAKGMVKRMAGMTGLALSDTTAVVPQKRIPEHATQTLVIDGVSLELITPSTAHTMGDMMVFIPQDGVLASGDVLVHGVNPNINDGNLKSWLGVLDEIRKLPVKVAMPGHGALMAPEDIVEFQGMMTSFYKAVLDTYNAGGDMSDVRNKLDLDKWQKLSRFNEMIGRNISKVWLEVEADSF